MELGKYKHFKSGEYEVIGLGKHSETLDDVVIYKPLYDTDVEFWVRPVSNFTEEVEINGKKVPRFEKIR